MGFVPELVAVVFVPILLRNQIWDVNTTFLARNCGAALSREEQGSLLATLGRGTRGPPVACAEFTRGVTSGCEGIEDIYNLKKP